MAPKENKALSKPKEWKNLIAGVTLVACWKMV
jgi:hypothetical protein